MNETSEERQSLLLLTASPLVWAAHFLACYATASIWCAKVAGPGGPIAPVRLAFAAFTALALGAIGLIGWIGYRRHTYGGGRPPHDEDTPEDRHRFLGHATFLVSGLSAVAVLYAASVAVFFGTCH
jgi:hypothetical protein